MILGEGRDSAARALTQRPEVEARSYARGRLNAWGGMGVEVEQEVEDGGEGGFYVF